jgi:hypothetical protein
VTNASSVCHVTIVSLPGRPSQGANPQTHRLCVDHRCFTPGEHGELTDCWWGEEVMERLRDPMTMSEAGVAG